MADLAGLSTRADEAGIFCDFDGCLSDIVPDPDDAKLATGASGVLARLTKKFSVVTLVSGRAVRDLASRVRAEGVRLVGLHGLEEIVDGRVRVLPEAEGVRDDIENAAREVKVALRGLRGVIVKHKGLALAVHMRRAPNPDEAERIARPIVERISTSHKLRLLPGRRILELRPPLGGDKGHAVARIVEELRLRGALVAGDDAGDIPAFDAITTLDVAVRVAVASDESPAALIERADLVVGSPNELVALLKKL
ncbi:MAG: trehalose-phosphatase [Actinomycetota bacterium]